MDGSQPDQKRPRLTGPPPPTQWHTAETSRQLPPPPHQAAPYPQHNSPFPRPEAQIYPLDRDRDRRTSDNAPYESQESRRPSSGPPPHGFHSSHPPPQPSYATPREPMVKRDPSDEPPLQYRPPSTGNGSDSHVNPPTHHDPRFPPPQFDPARQTQSYTQGPFPPQTPNSMAAEGSYAQHIYANTGLPPRPDQFASVTYPSRATEQQVRKKAQRAAQACDSCRTLKAKCDEGRPSCTSCREKNIECRYRDPPPKQQDKASADIMDSIEHLKTTMTTFMERITNEIMELKRSQPFQHPSGNSMPGPVKIEHFEHEMSVKPTYGEDHRSSQSHGDLMSGPVSQSQIIPPQQLEQYQPPEGEDTEEDDASGEPTGPPKQPSIPVNHTTGAARLLLVRPIAEMCKGIMKSAKIKNERYPIIQENKRGLLRLFGRGEGNENPPMYDKEPTTDHADTTPGDGQSDASSPAAGEEWGQLGGLTPPGNPPQEITRGGINPEGMPDFSRETVINLVQIYKDEMNIMHPILIPRQLDALVENFLRSIPDSQVRPKQIQNLVSGHAPHAGFAGGAGFVGSSYKNPESPSNKRKRSPAGGEFPEHPGLLDHKPGHPFRNITAAIVMLCMALGKICAHKGKIPHAYIDHDLDIPPRSSSYGSSPALRNGYPQSPLQSSPSITGPYGISSPQESDRGQPRSRRQSVDGMFGQRGLISKPRNIDVIPGLAYFALATDVIGNQLGGNSLQHVHANILAGLYHGQLARVMESHAYIAAACRALQIILRPRLDRFKKLSTGNSITIAQAKDNPLIFAFWTCLQLESDIIAELPCPHSGILTYEDDMPGPNMQAAVEIDGFDPKIVESYHAQLFLRKHLNQLHNMFYRPSMDSPFDAILASKETKHFPTIEASQASLATIDVYARNMLWDHEKGEPANNILEARLRAKYYGAEVITYRNFILPILDSSPATNQLSTDFLPDINVPSVSKISCLADLNPKVRTYIEKGLRALVYSTTAFHGLGPSGTTRPIVTNIWGTAHAQWGNMLTLQACYLNPVLGQILRDIITRDDMVRLLEKTLAFLALVATPSSALELDRRILDYTARHNGFLPSHPGSSFSSSTAGDVAMAGH